MEGILVKRVKKTIKVIKLETQNNFASFLIDIFTENIDTALQLSILGAVAILPIVYMNIFL